MDLPKSTLSQLDDDNYGNWRTRILAGLTIKGLKHAISVDADVDEDDDDKARSYLILSCKDHLLPFIKDLDTARAIWVKLESIYQASSKAKVNEVRRQLSGLKKSPKESVSRYISRAELLRDQLLAAGGSLDTIDLISVILAGLPKDYDTCVQILEASREELVLSDIHAKLLVAEQRLQKSKSESEADATAFSVASPVPAPASTTAGNGGRSSSSKDRTCFYCNKPGHIAKDCRKKKRDKAKEVGGGSYASAVALNTTGHACLALPDTSGQPVWIVDSGATHHMTGDLSLLDDVIPVSGPAIRYADGVSRSATMKGRTYLDGEGDCMPLEDVYYVPDAKVNLVSVSILVQRGATVSPITRSGFKIRKGGVELRAVPNGGLYTVSGVPGLVKDDDEDDVDECKDLDGGGGQDQGGPNPGGVVCSAEHKLWHARLCHLGPQNMSQMVSKGMVTGLTLPSGGDDAEFCEPCVLAKQHREPFTASKSTPKSGLIHSDLCGPITPLSSGGNAYFLTVLEDESKYSLVYPLKTKDQAPAALKRAVAFFKAQADVTVKIIRTDRGGEFCGTAFEGWMKDEGIVHQKASPYSPQSNGAAERLNRTLVEKLRSILVASGAPKIYWAEALMYCNSVRNFSPVRGCDKTPHELLYEVKPDIAHLEVWGCKAYPLVPSCKRRKLDPTSGQGMFLGFDPDSKSYRVLMEDGSVKICREVRFREDIFPFKPVLVSPPPAVSVKEESMELELPEKGPADMDIDSSDASHESSHIQADLELASDALSDESVGAAQDQVIAPAELPSAVRRSLRDRRQPGEWWATAAVELQPDPTSLDEALGGDEAPMWKQAMQDEYNALMGNKTWELEPLPPGTRKLPVKWVFKRKRDAAGNIERYKARLVVLGCRQRAGVDYQEIYAPVGKHATLRTLLAVVAARDLELHQLDVANAFLNGELEEDVWIEQPPGYKSKGDENLACHLRKTLYGLKQSPRAWYLNLRKELEKIGFTASEADPGLFVHRKDGACTYVLIHVDDILIAGSLDGVQSVKDLLAQVFKVKDMGPSAFYLGMDLIRNRAKRTLSIGQKRYVKDILTKYGVDEMKPKSLPLPSTPLSRSGTLLKSMTPSYSEIIGSLMYLAVCSRPDISQAVGALARYMSNPTEEHYRAAKHVLAYLAGTSEMMLHYGDLENGAELTGYCDSDYAGDTDTRRSTTGFVYTLNGGAITWSSRLQPTVAASTTEAEYMSAASAVKEALWFRKLLPEFGIPMHSVSIRCDNQATIKLLKNPVSASRTKHIDVVHHFARERVARGEVKFTYVETEKMVADVLTKILPRQKFDFCRSAMGVH